jgi:hypothetical protein
MTSIIAGFLGKRGGDRTEGDHGLMDQFSCAATDLVMIHHNGVFSKATTGSGEGMHAGFTAKMPRTTILL